MNTILLVISFLSLSIIGCGVGKAVKAVPEMSRKLDDTNKRLDDTQGQLQKTDDKIAKTNNAIHLQTLDIALAEIFKPENTRNLAPPSSKMFQNAQIVAEEIYPSEFIKLVHLWNIELQNKNFDDVKPQSNGKYTQEQMDQWDYSQKVKMTVYCLIASLMPQEKIDEIVAEEISDPGLYESDALSILAARDAGIASYLVNPHLDHEISNRKTLAEVVTRLKLLKQIHGYAFGNRIKFEATGFFDTSNNVEITLDPSEVPSMANAAFSKLSVSIQSQKSTNSSIASLIRELDDLRK